MTRAARASMAQPVAPGAGGQLTYIDDLMSSPFNLPNTNDIFDGQPDAA